MSIIINPAQRLWPWPFKKASPTATQQNLLMMALIYRGSERMFIAVPAGLKKSQAAPSPSGGCRFMRLSRRSRKLAGSEPIG
jgi:hypothetical protein